jgi:hypothetical protein
MTKYTALAIILALRIGYAPALPAAIPPFASPVTTKASLTTLFTPAKLITFKGTLSQNKVILNWEVAENETANQFEIEKSIDGKNFKMAALVFSTEKTDTDKYEFYEKAAPKKVMYRIKVVHKNQTAIYSDVVEVNPDNQSIAKL